MYWLAEGILCIRYILFTAMLLLVSFCVQADRHAPNEYEVKAIFLLNILDFIKWPHRPLERRSDELHLCLLGGDPFGESMDVIRDHRVSDRRLMVRQINGVEQGQNCDLVFLNETLGYEVSDITSQLNRYQAFTVGDSIGYARQGVMLNFYLDRRNKLRFEINLKEARKADIRISSQLLRLARIIRD